MPSRAADPFLAADLTTPGHLLIGVYVPDDGRIVLTLVDDGKWTFPLMPEDQAALWAWWEACQGDFPPRRLVLDDGNTPPRWLRCWAGPDTGVTLLLAAGHGYGTFPLSAADMERLQVWCAACTESPAPEAAPG